MRRVLFLIHRWAGLGIAVFLLLQAMTGITIVFRHELRRVAQPMSMTAEPTGQRLAFGPILAAVRRTFPDHNIERADFPVTPEDVYWFRLEPPDGGLRELATVDPYTGSIRSSGSLLRYPVEAALYLHANLLLGQTGQNLVATTGLTLLVLAVTGAILWWPGRRRLKRALTIKWRAPRARLAFDLHQVPAICVVVIVVIMACTGAIVSLRTKLEPLVAPVSGPPSLSLTAGPDAAPQPIDSSLEAARALFPGDLITYVRFRGSKERTIGVYFNDPRSPRPEAVNVVWLDGNRASVLAVVEADRQPAGTRLLDWMRPIHTGAVAGLPGRLLVLATGLTLLVVNVAGFWLWLERRSARQRAEAFSVERKRAGSVVPEGTA